MALPSIAWRRVHQYAKIAQVLNLAPRKRSPPNGAPEQSGVQGLLYYYKQNYHAAELLPASGVTELFLTTPQITAEASAKALL